MIPPNMLVAVFGTGLAIVLIGAATGDRFTTWFGIAWCVLWALVFLGWLISDLAADWRARSRRPAVPGAIRCLSCGQHFAEAPPGWDCPSCGGPVSQHAGTVHVRRHP